MKRDDFSDTILPGWMRTSAVGFVLSLAGAVLGKGVQLALRGELATPAIVARVVAAGIYGFGVAFGALFLILLITGTAYWLLCRQ